MAGGSCVLARFPGQTNLIMKLLPNWFFVPLLDGLVLSLDWMDLFFIGTWVLLALALIGTLGIALSDDWRPIERESDVL